jgi:hypothetical protein
VKYISYNNNNNSNVYTTNFSTLATLPKLIVTEPLPNAFNISWASGNYNYVKMHTQRLI